MYTIYATVHLLEATMGTIVNRKALVLHFRHTTTNLQLQVCYSSSKS